MYTAQFCWKIILITRIRRKSDFRVWQLSTLVPIKMLVSSLTELHTPWKTLSFSIVSRHYTSFLLIHYSPTRKLEPHQGWFTNKMQLSVPGFLTLALFDGRDRSSRRLSLQHWAVITPVRGRLFGHCSQHLDKVALPMK